VSAIVPFLKGEAFDPDDISAMSMALNEVCVVLNVIGDATVREVIATRIVELALRGERRSTALRDRVIAEANGSALVWGQR
jgi:hypothetical protein